jgi:hypothetical protein
LRGRGPGSNRGDPKGGFGETSSSNKYSNLSAGGRNSNSYYSNEDQQEFYQLAIELRMELDINNPLKRIPVSFLLKRAAEKQVPKQLWVEFIRKELKMQEKHSIF